MSELAADPSDFTEENEGISLKDVFNRFTGWLKRKLGLTHSFRESVEDESPATAIKTNFKPRTTNTSESAALEVATVMGTPVRKPSVIVTDLDPLKDQTQTATIPTGGDPILQRYKGSGDIPRIDSVEVFQRNLEKAGFRLSKYGSDGKFGPETEAVTTAYQLANDLPPTGYADQATLDHLNENLLKVGIEPTTREDLSSVSYNVEKLTSKLQSTWDKAISGITGSSNLRSTQEISAQLIQDLQAELGISHTASVGIVANLAHESGGFESLQEISPLVRGSRGGYGYAQWTGSRRREFESWSAERGLDTSSYAANKGFLIHELKNTSESRVLAKLANADSVQEATQVFSETFLRPGIPHMASRLSWANRLTETAHNQVTPAPTADVT